MRGRSSRRAAAPPSLWKTSGTLQAFRFH
jgi:hypothetical protein